MSNRKFARDCANIAIPLVFSAAFGAAAAYAGAQGEAVVAGIAAAPSVLFAVLSGYGATQTHVPVTVSSWGRADTSYIVDPAIL